jgi:hypothetical protein
MSIHKGWRNRERERERERESEVSGEDVMRCDHGRRERRQKKQSHCQIIVKIAKKTRKKNSKLQIGDSARKW